MTVNTVGTDETDRTSRTAAQWLWPLLPIAASMFSLSALLYYHLRHDAVEVRSALQVVVASIYRSFGFAPSFLFFLLLLTWSSIWFVIGRVERPLARLGRLLAMTVMLGVFMNLGDGRVTAAFHKGELGAWLAERLVSAFGYYPSIVLVWAATFGALLLATDFFFSDSFERLRRRPAEPASDVGVEAAVTDHLKGLLVPSPAPSVPGAEPARAASAPPQPPAPEPDAGDEVEVEPRVEDPIEESRGTRRRSYFDRRQDAAERARGASPGEGGEVLRRHARSDDEWVPTAPDNQEIDNPESRPEGRPESRDAARRGARDEDPESAAPESAAPESDSAAEPAAPGVPAAGAWDGGRAPASPPPADDVAGTELDEDVFAVVERAPRDDEALTPAEQSRAETDELLEDEDVDAEEVGPNLRADLERDAEPADGEPSEPVVTIPRPEAVHRAEPEVAPRAEAAGEPTVEVPAARQQSLFGAAFEEAMVEEAIEIVLGSRRASATLLQRKLRIDYAQACQLLVELAARGIVELEADASHGRVVG